MAKTKPTRPKRPVKHKPLLPMLAGGFASVMGTVYSVATPENIKWLEDHGGRLFSFVAAGLAVANCIRTWRITKAENKP